LELNLVTVHDDAAGRVHVLAVVLRASATDGVKPLEGEAGLVDLAVAGRAVLGDHELRDATLSGATLERVELRGCDLRGLRGPEALRGARMPWNDVIENAALFAQVTGVEIVE